MEDYEPKNILIPTGSIPSLIGLNGQNVKSTELVSGCNVQIKRAAGSVSHAIISGSPSGVLKAEQIIKLAVLHNKEATSISPGAPDTTPSKLDVAVDLRTFIAEVCHFKAQGRQN